MTLEGFVKEFQDSRQKEGKPKIKLTTDRELVVSSEKFKLDAKDEISAAEKLFSSLQLELTYKGGFGYWQFDKILVEDKIEGTPPSEKKTPGSIIYVCYHGLKLNDLKAVEERMREKIIWSV